MRAAISADRRGVACIAVADVAVAQSGVSGETFRTARAAGSITIRRPRRRRLARCDLDPARMRAAYGDRDNIGDGDSDYGGFLFDAGNTGQTATLFVANASSLYMIVAGSSCGVSEPRA